MDSFNGIREAGKKDFDKCLKTLLNAFSNEETVRKMTENMKAKNYLLKHMYSMLLKLGFSTGIVYTASEDFKSVMVICPKEKASPGVWDSLSSGAFFSMFAMLPFFTVKDMRELFFEMERDKKNLDAGPCICLSVLGVDPEDQGKGTGGRLMEYLCSIADSEGKAVYLETQSMKNMVLK